MYDKYTVHAFVHIDICLQLVCEQTKEQLLQCMITPTAVFKFRKLQHNLVGARMANEKYPEATPKSTVDTFLGRHRAYVVLSLVLLL